MLATKIDERESVELINEGQKIFGVFHRPLFLKTFPVVLICHGLAGNKTGKSRVYVLLSEKLAAAGIGSLRIDFRGSGDSEGDFSEATLHGEVSDTIKGLQFLEQHPQVKFGGIGIFGRSMGGIVALMAASRFGKIKSAATWASLFDGHQWLGKWEDTHRAGIAPEQRVQSMRFNGQVPGYTLFKELFETNMLDEMHALRNVPLLNIHGEKDEIINIEHAERYKQARQQALAKSEFIRLPFSDHDFTDPEELNYAIHETCQWFKKTL